MPARVNAPAISGHAAGGAVGQPLARVRVRRSRASPSAAGRAAPRHAGGLGDRQHGARGRVGDRVAEHEVDLGGGEAVARLARGLRGVHEPGGHDLAAELADALLDAPLVALDALLQARELGPVGVEADAEDADPRAGRGSALRHGRRGSRVARWSSNVRLEVEVVDVVLVERRQRAEHDLAVGADRVLAEPAGLERLALLAGDAPGRRAPRRPGRRGSRRPWAPTAGTPRPCRP